MKRLILAAALLAALPVQARTFCAAAYDLTKNIGTARDNGVSIMDSMKIADQGDDATLSKFVRGQVEIVYSFPELTPTQLAALTLKACMAQTKATAKVGV